MGKRVFLLAMVLSILVVVPVLAADRSEDAAALAWMQAQQLADGGFSNGFSEGSDLGTTVEVILAVAAAGEDVSTWKSADGASPLDYMASQVAAGAVTAVPSLSKTILVAVATGQDPRNFAGADLVAELQALESDGMYGTMLFEHAYAVLALHNAGVAVPDAAIDMMTSNFTDDGAYALFGGTTAGTADTNTTAVVMQALVATGNRGLAGGAIPYLKRMQNEDGGFPYQKPSNWGTDSDANSTAVVLQALYAMNEPMGDFTPAGTDPVGALLALWDESTGAYYWQAAVPFANMMATAQAVQAAEGMTLVNVAKVGAANPPVVNAVAAVETPLLPESGGVMVASVLLSGLMLAAGGVALRRRS